MKLPFFGKNKHNGDSYLGLFLQENKVTGYVYELTFDKISILGQHPSKLANGMTNIVEDIDEVLFRLETDTNTKLHKTIFFVTSTYLDEDTKQIKKEFKPVIKSIIKELELEALGFIECYEAISTLIQKKDGHLNAILVELEERTANIFVYKNSKQVQAGSIERSESLVHDLARSFSNLLSGSTLPARVVLYPFSESHKELVNLVNHTWGEEVFVHAPKIEALSEEEMHKGLSEIFYTQLQETGSNQYMMDKNESEDEEVEKASLKEYEEEPKDAKKEVMGFAIGAEGSTAVADNNPAYPESEYNRSADTDGGKKEFFLTSPLSKFNFKSLPGLSFKKPLLIPLAVLGIIVFLLLGSEFLFHKQTLKVTFPTKTVELEEILTNDDLDIKPGNITAEVADSTAATGKKDIGEKAKGEVTIRSFDDKEKTITKGTSLEAEGKKFILDQDVKVASASVSADNSAKIAGQAKGNVTAEAIGPESNLEKGKKFQIGDLNVSTFFALNDSAFTGGTKKQAQTVAKKDIEDLRAKVLATGKKKGLDQMRSEVSQDQQIIDDLTEQSLEDVDFSKEVGDEAKEVTVKASVTTEYYAYSENDLKKALQKLLQAEVAEGYTLPPESIEATIEEATSEDDTIELKVTAKGKSIKKVARDEVLSEVKGKGKGDVDFILKSKFGAKKTELESKGISFFPWMPFFKKNITIEINSK